MSIAERLKEAREIAGLSQGQVAKRLGMHRPTISEIEAGRRKVAADELDLFAELYDVSVEWIVNGSVKDEAADARMLMAARELSKMSDQDLDRLMNMLRMLRKGEDK
ncbi:helix-turn-helix family protein [Paraburkholderia xenovorans LB400]|jgi:transcriptional regulator with XRE-family HTH domain|uniref:Transcriptional regulator, XRE family n=1 Tax=Paraburkholderia xenovorans (strain LB400) TaxID=266265 RepID=Q13ZS7_PARXL|nr:MULTISPECIES: helix-turn-helix transcriptional regulator [Paraburkholderia]ABE30412.1 Putative transcriptional regulator, XRE family [Paraburkholderia xenovorans LB400]AIP32859.1 helix-turn-helix family protein [Paraburkholderia xenovorans LB400]